VYIPSVHSRLRNARLGYVLDFDASPLTAEDRKLAEVILTDKDMDSLVELAFVEASLICTQLLHIPRPAPKPTQQKPLDLAPLGVPVPKAKSSSFGGVTGYCMMRRVMLRYAALCEDYEDAVKELDSQFESAPPHVVLGPPPPPTTSQSLQSIPLRSEIIDASGKLSLSMMLQARLHWQAGTTTRSEKVSQIDSKYALSRIARAVGTEKDDNTEPEKMTLQEASNLTRVLQDQNATIQESKPVKYRELRWKGIAAVVQRLVDTNVLPNIVAKNFHQLNLLAVGSMTIMWSGTRFYIGEIMDVFKKGAHGRHASVPSSTSISSLSFLSLRVYLPLTTGGEDDDEDDQESADLVRVAPLFSCYYFRIRLSTCEDQSPPFQSWPWYLRTSRGGCTAPHAETARCSAGHHSPNPARCPKRSKKSHCRYQRIPAASIQSCTSSQPRLWRGEIFWNFL